MLYTICAADVPELERPKIKLFSVFFALKNLILLAIPPSISASIAIDGKIDSERIFYKRKFLHL